MSAAALRLGAAERGRIDTAVSPAAVRLENVGKRYGDFHALRDVTVDFEAGAVHALVGQNGAGKSTCLGIIAGRTASSEGTVEVSGHRYPSGMRPAAARDLGVSAIYQELTVVPAMSAMDNVLLGSRVSRWGLTDRRTMRRRYADLCEQLGATIEADARAGSLSVADQQMLEIMRALSVECSTLLMDEPTAALSPSERASLFDVVAQLRSRGVTVFLVSHFLDEVLDHADTIAVFRDGRLVDRRPTMRWTKDQLVAGMLGSELGVLRRASREATTTTTGRPRGPAEEAGLRVRGLTTRRGVTDVDLDVRPGEIVGLGGLVGSGRSSLIRALSGGAKVVAGEMTVDGRPVRPPRTPRQAAALGIRHLPEDRKRSGIVAEMSAADNVLLGQHHHWSRWGMLERRRARCRVDELSGRYDLPPSLWTRRAGRLSGGNQQKLLLARTGSQTTRVLLADEPTRGIDIGAKSVILQTLRELADAGTGVVIASSDLEEIAAVADRIYVLRGGRVVAELDKPAGETTEAAILHHAFGLEDADV